MADGVLLKHGAGFDNSGLTAVPADVKQPIKFLGAGSKEPQQGAMPVIPAITKDMAINERYNIVPGYHGGEDVFRQTGVKTETGQTIDPGAGGITLNGIGKVLTSNTIIMSVENLRPEVIKDGVPVGDIVGTYQGFPDEE